MEIATKREEISLNMEQESKNESFSFTYSAKEQEELKKIRQKYVPAEEDKMEQVRRLDKKVTQKGTAVSIALGVIGTLLFGAGMSCVMMLEGIWFVLGIILGIIGLVPIGAAYPVYSRVTKQERAKIAPEILRLTEELMR